eukprot:4786097-Amphidinium_carterae.1
MDGVGPPDDVDVLAQVRVPLSFLATIRRCKIQDAIRMGSISDLTRALEAPLDGVDRATMETLHKDASLC